MLQWGSLRCCQLRWGHDVKLHRTAAGHGWWTAQTRGSDAVDNRGCLPQDSAVLGLRVGWQGDASIEHRFLARVMCSRTVRALKIRARISGSGLYFGFQGSPQPPEAPMDGRGAPTVPVSLLLSAALGARKAPEAAGAGFGH